MITIEPADILNLLKASSLGAGLASFIYLGLLKLGIKGMASKKKGVRFFIIGWSFYGIFTLGGSLLECNRIHKEKFAALPAEWQSFYTKLNGMDMNTKVQRAAIGNYIRNRSPSLTLDEYDALAGKELWSAQRTFAQNVIRQSYSLQQIIDFDFGKGKE